MVLDDDDDEDFRRVPADSTTGAERKRGRTGAGEAGDAKKMKRRRKRLMDSG